MRRYLPYVIVAALIALPALLAQAPFPLQQRIPVQIEPSGASTTSQTAWTQQNSGANVSITVTQAANASKTNYLTDFQITGGGATAASILTVNIKSGGTNIAVYRLPIPAGVNTSITPLIVQFVPPLAGLGPNQNMQIVIPAFGAGNTDSACTMHGFTQ